MNYLPTPAAADHLTDLGIETKPKTLEQMRWRGDGPAYYRIGNRVRYRVEDLEAWIREHRYEKSSEWRAEGCRGA